jgi:hypothetical protein
MITSEDMTSLNTADIKILVPCSELEQRSLKTVTNSDLMSRSDSMLGNFQWDGAHSNPALLVGSTQQHVVQIDCGEVENDMQQINVSISDTGGLCLKNKDCAAQNSKTGGVLVKDDIISDKCCLVNMEQSSGFSLTDNIFYSYYTAYKPWGKVLCGNTSKEGKTILKLQQKNVIGVSGNQQGLEQTVAHSKVNGNSAQSTQQRKINFITPVIHNVKLKSASFISDTDANGQTYGSNNSALEARGESIHSETFTS